MLCNIHVIKLFAFASLSVKKNCNTSCTRSTIVIAAILETDQSDLIMKLDN